MGRMGVATSTCIILLALSASAQAQTWSANLVGLSGNTARCDPGAAVTYTFTREGNNFSGSNPNGKVFTITLPADGKVSHEFKSSSGARLLLTGSAQTRQLEIANIDSKCKYILAPK